MAWSKRKPYYGLKLSVNEFFKAPVRYLRDYITKESILEKPYIDEDRGEMHQDTPSNPEITPATITPATIPTPTITTATPTTPAIAPTTETPTNPTGLPGVGESPTGSQYIIAPADPTQGGMLVQAACSVNSGIDCLSVGESGLIYAASNKTGSKLTFSVKNTAPEVVSVTRVTTLQDKAVFRVTAKKASDDIPVSIEIWGSWKNGYQSRCGLVNVFVPCCNNSFPIEWDTGTSETTIAPEGNAVVAVTQGTGPYTWVVTGTGFSISPKTESRFNLLEADDTSCGTATIVATDACGSGTTGYVRSTTGQWQATGITTCVLTGAGTYVAGYWYVTSDQYRLAVHIHNIQSCFRQCAQGGNCGDMCSDHVDCSQDCADKCASADPCTECITNYLPNYDYRAWPCFLNTSCGGGIWQSQSCNCNDEVSVEEWVC